MRVCVYKQHICYGVYTKLTKKIALAYKIISYKKTVNKVKKCAFSIRQNFQNGGCTSFEMFQDIIIKIKRQARKLEWKKKKNHDCSYTTYCNTVLSPESRKMSTPQTIHKTVLIFRIHFVIYLHNFIKNPSSEIKISGIWSVGQK